MRSDGGFDRLGEGVGCEREPLYLPDNMLGNDTPVNITYQDISIILNALQQCQWKSRQRHISRVDGDDFVRTQSSSQLWLEYRRGGSVDDVPRWLQLQSLLQYRASLWMSKISSSWRWSWALGPTRTCSRRVDRIRKPTSRGGDMNQSRRLWMWGGKYSVVSTNTFKLTSAYMGCTSHHPHTRGKQGKHTR